MRRQLVQGNSRGERSIPYPVQIDSRDEQGVGTSRLDLGPGGTERPLTREEMLAWAVRQEDAALAAELNQALALMKSNGTLQYILNRWIQVKIEVR